ncbi:hypothetical protein BC833DRAFT_655314 [Globomyces pollinis-pini]|nr:hypothetical protein BC833DRAFT_655314 [Globomyces pollinis-pini]
MSKEFDLILNFDGHKTPKEAMCAAVISSRDGKIMWIDRAIIGTVSTSNAAEYCGLINGLRRIKRELAGNIFTDQINLIVVVENKILSVYNVIARRLAGQFKSVKYHHVHRDQNQVADKESRLANFSMICQSYYYPNMVSYTTVKIGGKEINATNDILASFRGQYVMIDHRVYQSLFKKKALEDPSPLSFVSTKGSTCTVLGVLRDVKLQVRLGGYRNAQCNQVFVVENLPVPIHLAFDRLELGEDMNLFQFVFNGENKLTVDAFSSDYQNHPYWHSDVISIGASWQ